MGERLGFIGLGEMGLPMAENLLKAGFATAVYDVRQERTASIAAQGALAAASPADVAARSDIIVACLPNGDIVQQVVAGKGGILEACREGQVFIDTTTNYPPDSRNLSHTLATAGVGMLDAPVSGGPEGAAAATLSIMVGGETSIFERCLPVLERMGGRITPMGEAVGAGGYAKLANQIMVYLNLVSVLEALAYAERMGLDPEKLLPALQAGHADSVLLRNKGAKSRRAGLDAPGSRLDGLQGSLLRRAQHGGARIFAPFHTQGAGAAERVGGRGKGRAGSGRAI